MKTTQKSSLKDPFVVLKGKQKQGDTGLATPTRSDSESGHLRQFLIANDTVNIGFVEMIGHRWSWCRGGP